jgi:uncharacterized membrane protein
MNIPADKNGKAGENSPAFDVENDPYSRTDAPTFRLTLRPHRSLSKEGVTWLMFLVTMGFVFSLIPFLGTPVGWGLLPFFCGTLWLLWAGLMRNYRDADLREVLSVWPDLVTVIRTEPNGEIKRWYANPYWVDVAIEDTPKVEKYLTLKGNGRRIELGTFLTPDARASLYDDIIRALRTG